MGNSKNTPSVSTVVNLDGAAGKHPAYSDVGQKNTSSSTCWSETHQFTDADREAAIVRAGRAVEKHMTRWEAEGCFAARGDADRARMLMERLIAGRSPEFVARLEAERGLA